MGVGAPGVAPAAVGAAEALGGSEAAGEAEAAPVAAALPLAPALGAALGLCVSDGRAAALPAALALCVSEGRAGALPPALREGDADCVEVVVGEGEGARVALRCGVALRCALAEGEQVGAAARPVVVQPPQGQSVGAALPAGQKLPMGQMVCVALVEPGGQKYPALQSPVQRGEVTPAVAP